MSTNLGDMYTIRHCRRLGSDASRRKISLTLAIFFRDAKAAFARVIRWDLQVA